VQVRSAAAALGSMHTHAGRSSRRTSPHACRQELAKNHPSQAEEASAGSSCGQGKGGAADELSALRTVAPRMDATLSRALLPISPDESMETDHPATPDTGTFAATAVQEPAGSDCTQPEPTDSAQRSGTGAELAAFRVAPHSGAHASVDADDVHASLDADDVAKDLSELSESANAGTADAPVRCDACMSDASHCVHTCASLSRQGHARVVRAG
jgi:hypothetical protein